MTNNNNAETLEMLMDELNGVLAKLTFHGVRLISAVPDGDELNAAWILDYNKPELWID